MSPARRHTPSDAPRPRSRPRQSPHATSGQQTRADAGATEVAVIGGGIVGLAVAWRAASAGLAVAIVDDAPGSGASHVAAGMLAPVTEVAYGEEDLLALTIAGARRWPAFADELQRASGIDAGYRTEGTLLVAADADDAAVLRELTDFKRSLGLDVEPLRARACREREPLLSPRIAGGLVAHDDHHVDPRLVVASLRAAAMASGATIVAARARAIEHDGRAVTGVRLDTGGLLVASSVVLAAGSWSAALAQRLPDVTVPVRPVKGELLVLGPRAGIEVPRGTVRGLVHGRSVYLVPRTDGRLIVGATQQERARDTTVTAGGVRTLLDDAAAIVPGIDELELLEALAGSRPGTPDNRPLIGHSGLDGLVLATGHHRHGVLLAPITADAVVAVLTGQQPDEVVAVADPRRPALRGAPAASAVRGGGVRG